MKWSMLADTTSSYNFTACFNHMYILYPYTLAIYVKFFFYSNPFAQIYHIFQCNIKWAQNTTQWEIGVTYFAFQITILYEYIAYASLLLIALENLLFMCPKRGIKHVIFCPSVSTIWVPPTNWWSYSTMVINILDRTIVFRIGQWPRTLPRYLGSLIWAIIFWNPLCLRYKTVPPRGMSVGDGTKVCMIHLFLAAGTSEEEIICGWHHAYGTILPIERAKITLWSTWLQW